MVKHFMMRTCASQRINVLNLVSMMQLRMDCVAIIQKDTTLYFLKVSGWHLMHILDFDCFLMFQVLFIVQHLTDEMVKYSIYSHSAENEETIFGTSGAVC